MATSRGVPNAPANSAAAGAPTGCSGTPPPPLDIGGSLHGHRLATGLSVDAVARSAGIVPHYYREIERGLKSPSTRTLNGLAHALGLSLADLLGGPSPVPIAPSLDVRRAALRRLLDAVTLLDPAGLQSLVDYAGYLARARSQHHRAATPNQAQSPAPLFPDQDVSNS